ncbi:sacsin N-terminal ATP-binding-like domain-containing protein [Saprospira grandis]|uniref:sacsin N-terminal ATP-binding-like domain-containing protein n=1 Tax=Saprospira grandis TaxID=1008 RepID=UPI0022DD0CD7|nr:hypothetical protein [Saprospira grandis]WBM75338.1 hypothetical protein OP864_03640 [Saprospira grandis]
MNHNSSLNIVDPDDPAEIEKRNNRKLTADKIRQILSKVLERRSASERRWIWELMQNAKDVPNKFGSVSIQIVLEPEQLTFRHNGNPFSLKNIFSLIQQVSSKDSTNQNESVTGKFGTGFISTHLLSEIIKVKGVVRHKNTHRSFEVLLDRKGDTSEELLPKIEKALDKIRQIEDNNLYPIFHDYEEQRTESDYDTAFIYELNSEARFKSAKAGLDDLINTLPQTLANLKVIKRVEVLDRTGAVEEKQVYECRIVEETEIFRKATIDILGANSKNFICFLLENLVLLAEVNNFGEMQLQEAFGKQPYLFRDFPLIGSEKFYFPFIINGFKFNPTEDRDGILLHSFESNDANQNRSYIEKAIDGALEFSKWLIDHNAKNRFVCAFNRLPDEKWEDQSKEWYLTYQKDWRQKLLDLLLVETTQGITSLRRSTIPNYGNRHIKHEVKFQFYDLAMPILGKDKIPKRDLLIDWIDVLGPEGEQETWGINIQTDLEDLLKLVANATTKEELSRRHFDSISSTEEWLNTLYAFLTQEKKTELFDQYQIIPNQNGEFKFIGSLYLEDRESPIPDVFLDILKDIDGDLDWRGDLIDRNVRLPNQNIEKRSLTDIKECINTILKKRQPNNNNVFENTFSNRQDSLSILIRLTSIVDKRPTNDDIRANIFNKAKDLFKLEQSFNIVPGSKNFNYEPALKLLIEKINLKIQEYNNLPRLSAQLELDIEPTVLWLNDYLSILSKDTYSTLLNVGNIIPNRKDEFCAYEDIKSFGEEGVPLNDDLIKILYRLDNKEDWAQFLVRDGITIKFTDKKTFNDLGATITDFIKQIEVETANDPTYINTYKDALLDLIDWSNENIKLTRDYLNVFEDKAKEIFFKLTLEGSSISMNSIKMLQNENNIELLNELSKSDIDKHQLKKIIEIAGKLGSLGKILSHAKELLDTEEDFQFKMKIGTQVENIFKEALNNQGLNAEVIHHGKGPFDLEIKNSNNNKSFFIELKSFKQGSTAPLHFAESQANFAIQSPHNYAVCLLARPSSTEEITISYIQQASKFRMCLTPIFQAALNDLATFNNILTKNHLHLVFMEYIRIKVNKDIMLENPISFTTIVSQIKNYLA